LPKFVNWTSKGIQVDFDEEQPIASVITQFKAIDFDLNSSVFYFMKPDTMNNYFSINNSTGILSSKIKLDAEKHPAQFVFDVIAVDLDRSLSEQLAEPINEQKLKININLIDLNDNKPIITNKFNYTTLNYTTATDSVNSTHLFIYSIQSNDSDRDFLNVKKLNNRHLFRIGLIKYIDWNRLSHLIIHTKKLSIPLPLEQQQQQQLGNSVDLKNIFTLNISNETNKADLMLKKSKLAKNGLYLFQIQVIDRSMTASQKSSSSSSSVVSFKKRQFWKTEFMFKLFLYDESFQENDSEHMNSLFDKFWQTMTIKEQQQFLEESEQEYFQLNQRNNNSSSNGVSSTLAIQEFNLKKFMFSNSSDWIIYLISLFMFISILLISIISYKHYKASVINNQNDSTASTHDTNATNSPQQKSKSLTVLSQTNLSVDSSIPPLPPPPSPPPLSKQEQEQEQSASCSFFESFIQPPLLASNDLVSFKIILQFFI